MNKLTWLLLILALFLLPSITFALEGKVISIADGDTITILTPEKTQGKIRLYGIDCPENGQPFSKAAKKAISKLVAGKYVSIQSMDVDQYKRVVGVVSVGGVNVNEAMVRDGYAWQYQKYCKSSFCDAWLALERQARSSKIGLWADHDPIPPWEWRKGVRNSSFQKTNPSTYSASTGEYHGNIKSHVFHGPSCRHYNCKNCVQVFNIREEAVNSGYRPCGNCKP